MEMKVNGCNDCPLHFYDIDYSMEHLCVHPDLEQLQIKDKEMDSYPEWCPLKKEPLTISLTK